MRPKSVAVSAVAASDPVVLDHNKNPFSVGFGVVVSEGAVLTYSVQHTFDDPFSSTGLTGATWFDHESVTNQTASADGNYAFPIRAARLNVTSHTSGSATLTLIQGG